MTHQHARPSPSQLPLSPPLLSFLPSQLIFFLGEASLPHPVSSAQSAERASTHTHTNTHTHTQWKARTWDTRTHIKTHIAYSLMWQARSRIVLSDSIPDGKAVPPVYLAPGHPWDSLSAFFPLPKTCSPVYHLIDSQRKAKIDSVTPTSLNSFLAKQTLHALTC